MKTKNFFKNMFTRSKANQQAPETKSAYAPLVFRSLYDAFLEIQDFQLAAFVALNYYRKCSPVFTAIDTIAKEMTNIPPSIYDTKAKKWVDEHPVLELLAKPNADVVWEEFCYDFCGYFLATGNAYSVTTGNINKPPLELSLVKPQIVFINPNNVDGYAQTIACNAFGYSYTFTRDEVDGRFRFYDLRDPDAQREMYQTKFFNPTMTTQQLYGMSPLSPIFLEIEQYINLSTHNLSILRRGARPSGFLVAKGILSDKEQQSLREELQKFYSGSDNAGRAMLLASDGTTEFEFVEAMKSSRDMDFVELKKTLAQDIFKSMHVPLALISPESMTMDNLKIARKQLFDNCVKYMARRMFSELTNLLMYRYKGSENLIITYKKEDIEALENDRFDNLLKLKNLAVVTTNEMREMMGFEKIEGGDELYIPSSSIPIAEAAEKDDAPDDVISEIDQTNQGKEPNPNKDKPKTDLGQTQDNDKEKEGNKKTLKPKATRERFSRVMKLQVNKDGSRRFSDEEIEELANEHNLN